MIEQPTAHLEWGLNVECPACEENNDLARSPHDDEYRIAKRIFTDHWDSLQGWEVTCEHCKHEFKIEKVEY
jgi:hypothetical protein